jgi:hypothetical protein
MPTDLDYGASVPLNPRAPFVVQADPSKPPGDRFKDYIPKQPAAPTRSSDEVKRKNFMKAPVARYEQDYISGDQAANRREKEKQAIIEIAKQIYADEKNKREAYAHAEKMISSGKASNDELTRANKVIERMKPLTKEEAMEKATKQFYGVRS